MDPSVYAWYERLRGNPDDAEALAYLWEHYASRGEFQQLAMLAEQIAGRRQDPVSAADLFYRAGEIWAKNVGRPDKAVACYKRAFEGDPSQTAAVEACCQIYIQIGNHRAAAPLLERLLGSITDPLLRLPRLREAAALYAQAGDVPRRIACLEELYATSPDDWDVMRDLAEALIARSQTPQAQPEDATRAAELLGGLAVAMGPEHGLAFAEIALDTHPGCELAYQVVHEAYGAANRAEELAVRQIAFVTSNPTSIYTPVIRKSLADMYMSVGQVDDAITCIEPLVNDEPELSRHLAAMYRHAGRVEQLAALYEQLAPGLDDGQRVQDLKDLASLHGQRGDRAGMLDAMRRVLALSPADTDALTLLEDDLRARGELRELRDLLLRAVRSPACPPEVRVPRLEDVGRLSLDSLDDVESAIEAWREVVETIPTNAEALTALGRALERAGRWEEYAHVLAQRADLAVDEAERRDVLRRLADVHRDRRDDPNSEAAVLGVLWDVAPDDDEVSERLARARRDAGDLAGAAEVLRVRAERGPATEARARWAAAGEAHEAAGQLAEAIDAWRQVVALEADDASWAQVERLLARAGQHDVLYATLVSRADAMPEGSARAAIHARAATAARSTGDGAAALAQAERAVQMAPDDDSLAGALFDALEASGQRERLLTFATERSARMADATPKVELLRRAARFVGAYDPVAAAPVWQQVRDTSRRAGAGDDGEALDALMGLAELRGDNEALAALFLEAAEAASETDAKREILRRRVALLAGELGRPADALEALADLCRTHAQGHAETWASLEQMASAQGRFDLAVEALERQVALVPDDEEGERKAETAARLVALVEREVKEPAALVRALEVQHAADPGDLGVIQRLADLCEAEGRAKEAVGYLEQLLEIEGDDEEISNLSQRIAHLSDARLDDPQRAWDVLVGPVKTGDVACIEMMIDLANRRGLHAALVPVLSELAGRVSDRAGRSMLWRDVARRKEEHLGDAEGAFEAWVQAAVSKAELDDLARIDALAGRVKRPQRVMDAYRAALDGCGDPTTAHELSMRGVAAIEGGGGRAQAFEFALAALAKAPADDEVLEAVVRLVPNPKRHTDIFVAFDRRRRAAQSDAERFGVTLRAVETSAVLGERETAFLYVEQAIGQAVGRKEPDEEMLARVENACIQGDQRRADAGMVSGLVERYAKLAEEASEDNPRVSAVLLRRAGTLCEHELALMDEAFGLYCRAVSVWPDDQRGAAALEDAAGRMSRLGEVVTLYTRVIDEAYNASTARVYTGRRASLLADRLGRVEEAIEAYQRLAELAPRDLDVIRALQGLLERHGRWQPMLMALEREIEAGGDRAGVYRRMAALWETRLRNTFEARDCWKRVLKIHPHDEEAKAALARLERRATVMEDDLLAMAPPAAPAAPVAVVAEEVAPAPVVEELLEEVAPEVELEAPAEDERTQYVGQVAYEAPWTGGAVEEVREGELSTAHPGVIPSSAPEPVATVPPPPAHDEAYADVSVPRFATAPRFSDAPSAEEALRFSSPSPEPVSSFLHAEEVSAELVPDVVAEVRASELRAEAARSFTEAVEVSAVMVEPAVEEPVEEPTAWVPSGVPATSHSTMPPFPAHSVPPAPPSAAPGGALDALDELSLSDAEEVQAEEVEAVSDDDDAPSLDDLAALVQTPRRRE